MEKKNPDVARTIRCPPRPHPRSRLLAMLLFSYTAVHATEEARSLMDTYARMAGGTHLQRGFQCLNGGFVLGVYHIQERVAHVFPSAVHGLHLRRVHPLLCGGREGRQRSMGAGHWFGERTSAIVTECSTWRC